MIFIFQQFLEHIQTLRYEDKPDYELLQTVFRTAIDRRLYKDVDLFDWEKENNGIENESTTNNPIPAAVTAALVPTSQQQTQPILSNINNKISAYVYRFNEQTTT